MALIPTDEQRFLIELEFVQALCNAKYLNFLAVNKYFDDPAFIQFLEYLQYFKLPQYSKHLYFPQCLAFLDALISRPNFRTQLVNDQFVEFVHQQQGLHWLHDDTSN
jgi:mediator of RNA polymerase II transcription subunit 31